MEFGSKHMEFGLKHMEFGSKHMEFGSKHMEFGLRHMEFDPKHTEFGIISCPSLILRRATRKQGGNYGYYNQSVRKASSER